MPVNLKVVVGTINYTNYLHVLVEKDNDPGTTVWEDWIAVPVTSYAFTIPSLDPDVYKVKFYEADTDSSLGQLRSGCKVEALIPEYEYETIFYDPSNLPGTASLNGGGDELTDTYLINKTVVTVDKEAFRQLKLTDEYTFDDTIGKIVLLHTTIAGTENLVVTIRYRIGNIGSSGGGLYSGTLTITAATATLTNTDSDKRVRLKGTASTQVITMPALSSMGADKGFYFDNTCGGEAEQVKLLFPGSDRLYFNGLRTTSDEFAEFWISKGEHLLIRKFDADFWEVITEYKGTNVGERFAATNAYHPGALPENGALLDGDEYPRLYWWVKNKLQASSKISDDTLEDSGYAHPAEKVGCFVTHSTNKKFRLPNTQDVAEQGLKDFLIYGADSDRLYDYPGGLQDENVGAHGHDWGRGLQGVATGGTAAYTQIAGSIPAGDDDNPIGETTGRNLVKNIGVIYMRRI